MKNQDALVAVEVEVEEVVVEVEERKSLPHQQKTLIRNWILT